MTEAFSISEEVAAALAAGRGVVALETSVLAQGLPPPRNLEAAAAMTSAIRAHGVVPAWIAVARGAVLTEPGRASKVARRDLPIAVAGEDLGATTVSAMLWAAGHAGIGVVATGGIGGVHPGAGDVSADLAELARTPALLVCSGPKSIVDPVATLERLEELGVAVVGYRCDRLPFFVVREADVPLEHRVDSPTEAANLLRSQRDLGGPASIVLCNPVLESHALPFDAVEAGVRGCEERAAREGIRGKGLTPFLLSCLAERTQGASLEANLALLQSNASLAGEIAAASADAAAT